MDAKKTIMKFIKPNLIPVIIMLVIPPITIIGLIVLLVATLPAQSRAKKCIAKLEADGELEKAAAELMSDNKKTFIKGKLVLTENYIFSKEMGFAIKYSDILWTYWFKHTQSVLLIPIVVTNYIYFATKEKNPRPLVSMGRDKTGEIQNAIVAIHAHNNKCLVGYSKENAKLYKELKKQ